MEFGERSSQRYHEERKDIDCPLCATGKVSVTYISGWMEWKVSRIASGSKRTPFFHDPKTKVSSSCNECKATRMEIKEALERGKRMSHEERMKRIRDAGLPTQIESAVS